jgi:DNA replicative helicase MCM subunit Mcm2 (Cdc46/Mcm family)
VIDGIREAVCFARGIFPIRMDPAAESIWREVYPTLSEGAPGLFGAVTNRGEAQVIRLALVYAMLDQSRLIGQEHLMAALALWDYCLASVLYIFGDSRGGLEDEILKALANGPMTRTDLYNHFGRNKRSAEIGGGLSALMAQGAVRLDTDKDTAGVRLRFIP